MENLFEDTLKAFYDFKITQKIVWSKFLVCKCIYILKIYSVHYTLKHRDKIQILDNC